MFFINFKIRIANIHNSLHRSKRNIISLSNRCKLYNFFKFKSNTVLKIIRYIRVITDNISRNRESFLTILTNISLYSKLKFNIVIFNRNIFNFMMSWTIFNNIFGTTVKTSAIIGLKKSFKNFNSIITFFSNLAIFFFWKRNIIILNI